MPDPMPEAERVLYRLMLVADLVGRDFARRFARHRLSPSDWRVLLDLHRDGAGTAAAIARRTGLAPAAVGRSVAALREAGRVRREPDPADARRLVLALTPRGRALAARLVPEGEALARALLAGVPEARHAGLAEALGTMLEAAPGPRTGRPPG